MSITADQCMLIASTVPVLLLAVVVETGTFRPARTGRQMIITVAAVVIAFVVFDGERLTRHRGIAAAG